MSVFLLKTEPSTYSYDDLVREKRAVWDGISNPVALRNLGTVKKGDDLLIYHTGDIKAVVGLARAASDAYPDPKAKNPKQFVVDIEPARALARPVSLATFREDAVLGEKTWHAQSRFRVVIGPLSFPDYERFLPRGRSSRALHDLIRLYVGVEQSWEVRLVLKKNEVPLAWLGNSISIGWTSWLGARLTDRDAADYSNAHGRHLPPWGPEPKVTHSMGGG